MKKRVYIAVNGINTFPGSSKNWNRRLVTYTHINTPHRAESLEYLVGPISRAFGQKKRSKKLLRKIEYYMHSGWEIVLVGHSNGCDIITDSLKVLPEGSIKEVHLLSAACEADFDKNGINDAKPEKVSVWIATKDGALKLARLKPAKWLGYGTLGKTGPIHASLPVQVIEKELKHSGWFTEEEFETTMKGILCL